MPDKTRMLYWGYSFHQEHAFKDKRQRRQEFMDELHKDARKAGLIK